jgi:serine phosphatase RsbU (regulator of sigma subunit)
VQTPAVAPSKHHGESNPSSPGAHAGKTVAPPEAPPAGAPRVQGGGRAPSQPGHLRRASERAEHRREAREVAGSGAGAQQHSEVSTGTGTGAAVLNAARAHEKPGKGKGKEPHKGHKQPPPARGPVEKPQTAKLAAAPAPVAVAAALPVAPVAPAPSVAPATPSIAGEAGAVATAGSPPHPARARGGVAGARAAAAVAQLAALVRTPASAGAHVAGAARSAAAKPAKSKHAGESPLVTTVTKIINVVPPSIRFLIAGLVALALALAASSRLTARRVRRLARQRTELLDDVGLLQAALLPALPGRLGPVGTSAAYRPASGPAAGGDFYDVFALGDGQIAVIVGDVSGHGRRALPHTALLRFTLRAYLEAGLSPRSAIQTAAPVLERQLGDSLATVALATYNPRERTLVYACAGHPPPIVIGASSVAPITLCSAPPIGAGGHTGTRQSTVSIPGGALVCFYTDGVVEARVDGQLFGAPRLAELICDIRPEASAAALLDSVEGATDARSDDMAACLLRIEGDAQAPVMRVEELELDRREAARGRAQRFLLAGGLDPLEIETVLASVRSSVARQGRVLLSLHLGDGPPRVSLQDQNVTTLEPPIQPRTATAGGISI